MTHSGMRCRRRDQFHKCGLGLPSAAGGHAVQPLLQPHIVQPQRVRDCIHAVLPRQFDRRASTATPVVCSDAAVCCETAPTGAAVARLVQE